MHALSALLWVLQILTDSIHVSSPPVHRRDHSGEKNAASTITQKGDIGKAVAGLENAACEDWHKKMHEDRQRRMIIRTRALEQQKAGTSASKRWAKKPPTLRHIFQVRLAALSSLGSSHAASNPILQRMKICAVGETAAPPTPEAELCFNFKLKWSHGTMLLLATHQEQPTAASPPHIRACPILTAAAHCGKIRLPRSI